MNLIVDTNIVFSAMWNTNSRIANILTNQDLNLNFFSPAYLLLEISDHQEKLNNRLQLNREEFLELRHLITRRIRFIAEDQLSINSWVNADELTRKIDSDDIAFVALALELNCPLWTGDKQLSKGITGIEVFDTNRLNELLAEGL